MGRFASHLSGAERSDCGNLGAGVRSLAIHRQAQPKNYEGVVDVSSTNHAGFIWSVADLLRGSFKAHQYGDIILPFTVLRRLDCVLLPTKQAVLDAAADAHANGLPVKAGLLKAKAGHTLSFWNTSPFTLTKTLGDPDQLASNLNDYLNGFSENVQDIFTKYKMAERIQELADANLLFHVTQRFTEVDLSPAKVPNEEMGHIFEELIRKFAEASNETAGEHFTPRDVVRLMVDLLLTPDADTLTKPDIIRSIYDPTAGTGGMLSVGEDRITELNPSAKLHLAGQEINPQSYAICKADMMMKGQPMDAIQFGNTLLDDRHAGHTYNYCLSNPPFGVDWKKEQTEVLKEHTDRGFAGRFGAGVPPVSDGAMLFLMHLISKMRDTTTTEKGGRAAIVLNGSPLFTGGAGSGPSNIRKWILDRDLLEAIVALPTDMFYNTGIATYIWILSTDKSPERAKKVQLIDGSKILHKMKKGLGSKRNELDAGDIREIVRLYGEFEETDKSKIFRTTDFFYRAITVERPLQQRWVTTAERSLQFYDSRIGKKLTELHGIDAVRILIHRMAEHYVTTFGFGTERGWESRNEVTPVVKRALEEAGLAVTAPQLMSVIDAFADSDPHAAIVVDVRGKPVADPDLRDTESVPWDEDIDEYFAREVLPFAEHAWIDHSKTKEGCEIPFTRHFYVYTPPRPLEDIDRDLDEVLGRIRARLEAVRA